MGGNKPSGGVLIRTESKEWGVSYMYIKSRGGYKKLMKSRDEKYKCMYIYIFSRDLMGTLCTFLKCPYI